MVVIIILLTSDYTTVGCGVVQVVLPKLINGKVEFEHVICHFPGKGGLFL